MHADAEQESPSVLVVDDDLDMGMMLGEFVQACGLSVDYVQDFPGFLKAMERRPCLLTLDLIMPDFCSERVIDWLVEHAPSTVLVLVSSLGVQEIEERANVARAVGMRRVLTLRKPFWPQDVAALLQGAGVAATDTRCP